MSAETIIINFTCMENVYRQSSKERTPILDVPHPRQRKEIVRERKKLAFHTERDSRGGEWKLVPNMTTTKYGGPF